MSKKYLHCLIYIFHYYEIMYARIEEEEISAVENYKVLIQFTYTKISIYVLKYIYCKIHIYIKLRYKG